MVETPPRLTGLATAVPPYELDQAEVRALAAEVFSQSTETVTRLLPAFDNAGVARRHACLPLTECITPRTWAERNALYEHHATELLVAAARRTLSDARLDAADIDALAVVSTTGIATPSLDARLINRLPFRADIERLPVFGLGCGGGVLGLGRAAALARAKPGRRVLLLTVELCTLTFRAADQGKSNIIAAALFGDGAAGAVVSTAPEDGGPTLCDWGEYTWPDTLDVMGWDVAEDGLGVRFARAIPTLVRERYGAALDGFLDRNGLARSDLTAFACHPGGAKVVTALEEVFGLAEGQMSAAREVLRDYGNMSAPTALFVLERLCRAPLPGPMLASALGPGFSAGFALILPPTAA
jgi:alkylresorcinol/alkylpyrone synthase